MPLLLHSLKDCVLVCQSVSGCHLRLPRGTGLPWSVGRNYLVLAETTNTGHTPQSTSIHHTILVYENCISACCAWPLICRQDRGDFISPNSLFSKEVAHVPKTISAQQRTLTHVRHKAYATSHSTLSYASSDPCVSVLCLRGMDQVKLPLGQKTLLIAKAYFCTWHHHLIVERSITSNNKVHSSHELWYTQLTNCKLKKNVINPKF